MGGGLVTIQKIMRLCGSSCKLRLSRFSAVLTFQCLAAMARPGMDILLIYIPLRLFSRTACLNEIQFCAKSVYFPEFKLDSSFAESNLQLFCISNYNNGQYNNNSKRGNLVQIPSQDQPSVHSRNAAGKMLLGLPDCEEKVANAGQHCQGFHEVVY